jgi:tetratricopeptide (TPR) repeat protein
VSEVNTTLKELLTEDRLTFLIGAGCSIDPPSSLAAGRQMMGAIIRYASPESEAPKLLALDDLRFEALVETFRDVLDRDLRLLDYFGECDRPNLHHLFLAEMLQKGNFVVTTNFDFLIEHALLRAGVDRRNVIPVITQGDYLQFDDPQRLAAEGKYLVVKVHGSTRNVITNENTRESLIATIQAFGVGKEGVSVFQVEPFKQRLLESLFFDRTLVVLGYSGSDDFDVVPTLAQLRHLRKIVWINHARADAFPQLTEVTANDAKEPARATRVERILSNIQRGTGAQVYRVDMNTSSFTRLFITAPASNDQAFSLTPTTWLEAQVAEPSELHRHIFAYKIYHQRERYLDALLQCFAILEIADEIHNEEVKADFLSNIGALYQSQNDYPQAIKAFEKSLKIVDSLRLSKAQAVVRSNLASLYFEQKQYENALHEYMQLVPILERESRSAFQGVAFSNLGTALVQAGRWEEALRYLRQALDTFDHLGDLLHKATVLSSIAHAHANQKDFGEADRYWSTALDLYTQLSDYAGQELTILSMARSLSVRGKHRAALALLRKGYPIVQQRPWSRLTADYNGTIADAYLSLGEHGRALTFLEPTIEFLLRVQDYQGVLHAYHRLMPIIVQSGDQQRLADAYYDMATAYQQTNRASTAIEHFEKMLPLLETIDPSALPAIYNSIGGGYLATENYQEARRWFDKSLERQREIDPTAPLGVMLLNIGLASLKLQDFDQAADFLEQARAQFAAETPPVRDYLNAASANLAFTKEMMSLAAAGHDPTARVRELRLRQIETGVTDDLTTARRLVAEGRSYFADGKYASAEKSHERAGMLFAQLGAKEDLAKTRRHIAEAALMQANPERAFAYFVAALLDFQNLGDYAEVVQTSHGLGILSEQLERFSDAIDFYKRAFVESGKIGDPTRQAIATRETAKKLAEVMALHGEPSESTQILEFALQRAVERSEIDDAERYAAHLARLYGQVGNVEAQGRALNTLGNASRLKGNCAAALKYFEEAARCFEAANNQELLQFAQAMMRQLEAKADSAAQLRFE